MRPWSWCHGIGARCRKDFVGSRILGDSFCVRERQVTTVATVQNRKNVAICTFNELFIYFIPIDDRSLVLGWLIGAVTPVTSRFNYALDGDIHLLMEFKDIFGGMITSMSCVVEDAETVRPIVLTHEIRDGTLDLPLAVFII